MDPVVEDFIADTSGWVAGLQAAIDISEQFRDSIYEDVAAVEALRASLDDLPYEHVIHVSVDTSGVPETVLGDVGAGALGEQEQAMARDAAEAAAATGVLDEATSELARNAAGAAAAEGALGDALGAGAARAGEDAAATKALSEAQVDASLAALAASMSTRALSDSASAAGTAARAATGFWATWGTVIHWVVAGGAEFLAVAIPGTVAFGAGMLVAAEGATWLGDKLEGVYTATEATGSMLNTTAGEALGLKGALQQAQTAADPGVYEMFGAGLSIAKSSLYSFAGEGLDVIHVMDEFSARAAIDLGPGGPLGDQLTELLGNGVTDLTEFGQILGNLGHFIVNFASEMPGLAEVLLGLIDDFTRLLNVLADPSWWNFHGELITIAMGAEEAWRWGGLLSNILGSLATRAAGAADALGGMSSGLSIFGSGQARAAAEVTQAAQALETADEALITFRLTTAEAAAATEAFTAEEAQQVAAGAAMEDYRLSLVRANAAVALSDAELGAAEAATAAETFTLSGALEGAGAFLTGPWGWAVIGATVGLGLLFKALADTKTAAQQFAGNMEQAVDKANFTQGLSDIITDLPKLNDAFNESAKAAGNLSPALAQLPVRFSGVSAAQATAVAAAVTYHSAIEQLTTQAGEILGANVKVGNSYASVSEAMALAGAAGLTVGTAFQKDGQLTAVASQQIQDLIAGYKEMDQTGTTLANDINAINEQALMQQTEVSKLNQAWDGFISNMTGVSSSVASLYTDLTTIGNVTEVATSKIQAFSQGNTGLDLSVKQVAQALSTFGAGSAQVWTNFDSAVGQAEQALDGIRTAAAAGGVTNTQYSDSVKGIVAQLLPYAQDSSTATSELSALAQQAGDPATSNFQTLSRWVGNTKNATQNLNQIVQQATQYMSNLGTVAANLASTMASAVDSAITSGAINIKGITTATQGFEAALRSTGGEINSTMIAALQGMITQMRDAGVPTQDQISILDQLARQAGLSSTAIQALNREIQSLQNKTVTVTVETQYITSGGGASAGINPAAGGVAPHAAGWLVPGFGGGDIHPALLEGGETVVPKELTPAVAPLMKAHGVPGFESGGIAGGWYDNGFFPGLSSMLSGASGGSSGGGGGGLPALELHLHGDLADKNIWENGQIQTLRYNFRNSGKPTGAVKPS